MRQIARVRAPAPFIRELIGALERPFVRSSVAHASPPAERVTRRSGSDRLEGRHHLGGEPLKLLDHHVLGCAHARLHVDHFEAEGAITSRASMWGFSTLRMINSAPVSPASSTALARASAESVEPSYAASNFIGSPTIVRG